MSHDDRTPFFGVWCEQPLRVRSQKLEEKTLTDPIRRRHIEDTRTRSRIGQGYGPPWEPNWISFRSSRANVHRRIDRGQCPPTCAGCGCETDVAPTPHSPNCKAPA